MEIDKAYLQAPKTYPAPAFEAPDVKAMFYDGPVWKGKPTRVFAWYAIPDVKPGEKVPAMVLVHGGGGTAFPDWVRMWAARGYAAISMDVCGCVPRGTQMNWQRHPAGGPEGWGGFYQLDWDEHDQWTYQAVSDVVLANSLVRSWPQVDPDRVGVTGVSWGGYLTSIVSALDERFRFAIPVYGCGFLTDNSAWVRQDFQEMAPKDVARWASMWDPSQYLPRTKMPMLWLTGTNDFAYPLDSLQKSYRLPKGPRTLSITVRMLHQHTGRSEDAPEILAFADSFLRAGKPLAKIVDQGRRGEQAWASYTSDRPIAKAELNFTNDLGDWEARDWQTIPADVRANQHEVSANLPATARVCYFNLIDDRGLIVSTEHVETAEGKIDGK